MDHTSKTSRIRQYFIDRPGQIFGPADIAMALKLESQVTTAILNRLVSQGVLQKPSRGQFSYSNDTRIPSFPFGNLSLTPPDARILYEELSVASENTLGSADYQSVLGSFEWDDEFAAQSILEFLSRIRKALGEPGFHAILLKTFSNNDLRITKKQLMNLLESNREEDLRSIVYGREAV